jgi:hypothetical protein
VDLLVSNTLAFLLDVATAVSFILQLDYYTYVFSSSQRLALRRMRWAGHVARMREKRNVYRLLVGKPEGKRRLGRPRRRWIDNIKMDF